MDRSPERDSDRPRNGKLDRDRHENPRERQTQWLKGRQKGRQAQEKGHCLSIRGSKAGTGTWKGGRARNGAEISGLLGWGCRPWGGFLSWGAGGKSQREVAMAAGWPHHTQNV